MPQAEFISAEDVKCGAPMSCSQRMGLDPDGIVSGLRELGYAVELVK